jgi:glyoxylase-like metal-dependent hydrolase (beta-lactamase superfamily II)
MTELQSWTIGAVRVTKVVEMVVPVPPAGLLPAADEASLAAHRGWLQPDFVDREGNLLLSVHALVVESAGRTIVVDTCVGNGKVRPYPGWSDLQTDFLDRFAGAGFDPAAVDLVICTHLHFDHVGWNTNRVDGAWVPTFANARYLVARSEWEHWSADPSDEAVTVMTDSVRPVVEAGLVDLVESDHVVTAEVRLDPTPGHTPGHVAVCISSAGADAVITGDLAHHPVQLAEPAWGIPADVDGAQAVQTRRRFIERYGGRPVLVIGTHFAGPTAGHVARSGPGWRFVV